MANKHVMRNQYWNHFLYSAEVTYVGVLFGCVDFPNIVPSSNKDNGVSKKTGTTRPFEIQSHSVDKLLLSSLSIAEPIFLLLFRPELSGRSSYIVCACVGS
jgi:hypothetical protein